MHSSASHTVYAGAQIPLAASMSVACRQDLAAWILHKKSRTWVLCGLALRMTHITEPDHLASLGKHPSPLQQVPTSPNSAAIALAPVA